MTTLFCWFKFNSGTCRTAAKMQYMTQLSSFTLILYLFFGFDFINQVISENQKPESCCPKEIKWT